MSFIASQDSPDRTKKGPVFLPCLLYPLVLLVLSTQASKKPTPVRIVGVGIFSIVGGQTKVGLIRDGQNLPLNLVLQTHSVFPLANLFLSFFRKKTPDLSAG